MTGVKDGGNSSDDTPVPIPNTEVKSSCADDSRKAKVGNRQDSVSFFNTCFLLFLHILTNVAFLFRVDVWGREMSFTGPKGLSDLPDSFEQAILDAKSDRRQALCDLALESSEVRNAMQRREWRQAQRRMNATEPEGKS